MNSNCLISSKTAETLYEYAKSLPIIDYHNHLSVSDLIENKRYTNIYDLWIKPDPYKHRAMRMCGVPERYITGDAPTQEKFRKWCETLPSLIGNPLYIWTKMELEAVFHITKMPNAQNADEIYALCNKYLADHTVTPMSLLEKFRAERICPCMSIVEDVTPFDNSQIISPSLRGDDIVNVTFAFVERLASVTSKNISSLADFENAVKIRLQAFMKCGCDFSDHALDNGFRFYKDDGMNAHRFQQILANGPLGAEEQDRLSSYILAFLAEQYAKHGFVMQLHIGAQRYTSTRLRNSAGAAGGYAGIGNSVDIKALTLFLDTVDKKENGLPKTILFTLNPADHALISVLSGSYAKDGVKGLVTEGPAWWWCDHKQGIREMLENSAAYGLLSNFVGMTTDSRSFLSFVRHDYFRRILCDFLGEMFEKNDLCCSYEDMKRMICAMCFQNAKTLINRRNIQ